MEFGGEKLGPVLLKALNRHQRLILREIPECGETATSLLTRLSRQHSLPLSTLKLNMRKLISLGLVLQEKSKPVVLTPTGALILSISQNSLTDKATVCKTANPGSSPGSETR